MFAPRRNRRRLQPTTETDRAVAAVAMAENGSMITGAHDRRRAQTLQKIGPLTMNAQWIARCGKGLPHDSPGPPCGEAAERVACDRWVAAGFNFYQGRRRRN